MFSAFGIFGAKIILHATAFVPVNYLDAEKKTRKFSIKGLDIGETSHYVSFRAEQGQLKPIDRRAVEVHKEHYKAAACG